MVIGLARSVVIGMVTNLKVYPQLGNKRQTKRLKSASLKTSELSILPKTSNTLI